VNVCDHKEKIVEESEQKKKKKCQDIKAVNQRSTDNTMAKRKKKHYP